MTILALEFSSPRRSVAVSGGNTVSVIEVVDDSPVNTMKPFAIIESALRQAGMEREQIDYIAVGLGPGSYTGIRAAIALAQGWHLARAVKLIGISSANSVAAQAAADGITGRFDVVIDAQRGEFYLAGFETQQGVAKEVSPLRLASMADVRAGELAGAQIVGPEVLRWFPNGRIVFPSAARIAHIAAGRREPVVTETLEPIYLRETTFVKAPPSRHIN